MADDTRPTSVFVNCPFDPVYGPLLNGLAFAVIFCGFRPRSALEITDSGDLRLSKILRLIEQSRFSIHDISRVELDRSTGLPRFNMPLELGISLGMKHLGRDDLRDHALLVLDTERYRYQAFASDLAGVDIAAHNNSLPELLATTRSFLASHTQRPLPGPQAILEAHDAFEARLPDMATNARQQVSELTYVDRLQHVAAFMRGLA